MEWSGKGGGGVDLCAFLCCYCRCCCSSSSSSCKKRIDPRIPNSHGGADTVVFYTVQVNTFKI